MTTITSVRLTRDRATWLIYLQLGVFATYLYGLSAALPLLRIDQGSARPSRDCTAPRWRPAPS
nr:hypothetical protein GCM10020093_066770 [Planobispora longispora]